MKRYLATVVKGHQIASGLAENSPYPAGSIALQMPVFQKLGLDLSAFYPATINLQFDADRVRLTKWHYQFEQVCWLPGVAAESFRFLRCQLQFGDQLYDAMIYQPVAETKVGHFQASNVLELLAAKIDDLHYGDTLQLLLAEDCLDIG